MAEVRSRVTPAQMPNEGVLQLWELFKSQYAHLAVFDFERCHCWCGEQHLFDGDLATAGSTVFWIPTIEVEGEH